MLTRYVQHHLTWIDLVSPNTQEVRSLVHEFGIESKIAEELLLPSFKEKVEKHHEHIYLILHFPALRGTTQRAQEEIDFVVGKNFLITARYSNAGPLHAFAKAFEVNAVLGRGASMQNGGHLFAAMTRNLYGALDDECTTLARRLDAIEERIFGGAERQMVVEISQTGRIIHDFRQALLPHEEMLRSFEAPANRLFGPEFSYYLRSVIGEYERVKTTLENLRDSLIELRETNNSLLSTKQNEVMKTLTALAFLFLPLTFIGQVLGMSIPVPLASVPNGFWMVVGGMMLIALCCLAYFKRKGWL